ncbi:unnamed protein product [Calypogeia fissa]
MTLVTMMFLVAAAANSMMAMAQDSGFCSEIIEPYILYNCTEYKLTTFDGFQLSIQLVQLMGAPGIPSRGDVLFLHPSILGGSSWFLASTPIPLAIADAGYSVWIGQTRTTQFSFGHVQLTPDQQEYWNWDMDELANYDLPSFIDFVNGETNGRKFHFVGYSQGARVGLSTISYQWNRAAMLSSVTLLAPVVYMQNTLSRVLIAMNYTDMAELGYHLGVGMMNFSALVGDTLPADSQALHDMENEFLCQLTGPNCCVDPHVAYTALTGPYSLTTYKNLAHLTQSMRSEVFMAYDYGSDNSNTEVYQSKIPPQYKFNEIPTAVPIFVLYGGNDRLSTPADIYYMMSALPAQPQILFNPTYAHLDYLLSSAMMQDVNLPILNFLGKYDNVW